LSIDEVDVFFRFIFFHVVFHPTRQHQEAVFTGICWVFLCHLGFLAQQCL
jgi:hypothetical protein